MFFHNIEIGDDDDDGTDVVFRPLLAGANNKLKIAHIALTNSLSLSFSLFSLSLSFPRFLNHSLRHNMVLFIKFGNHSHALSLSLSLSLSVTRFGKFSPLWLIFAVFGANFKRFI